MPKPAASNPFKIADSKTTTKKSKTELTVAPDAVAKSVDEFCRISGEIKSLDGELSAHKRVIAGFAKGAYAENAKEGDFQNLKIQGVKETCLWITMDKSSEFAQEDRDAFAEKYGDEIADEVLEIDYGTFRLNPEVMADPKLAKEVMDTLGKLQAKLGDVALLQPGKYRAKKGAVEALARNAKDAEQLAEMIDDARITAYARK